MRKIKFFLVLLLLVTVKNIQAYTYLGVYDGIGDLVIVHDARSLAMGNTSVASNRETFVNNPANLLKTRRGGLGFTGNFYPVKETLETEDEPTLFSSAYYYDLSNINLIFPLGRRLSVGFARVPYLDHSYRHSNKGYSEGILNSTLEFESTGRVSRTVISTGWEIADPLRIGFNYNLLGGKKENSLDVIIVENQKYNVSIDQTEYSGSFTQLGMDIELKKDTFNLSFKWSPSHDLESKWAVTYSSYSWQGSSWTATAALSGDDGGTITETYPSEIGIGLSYEFYEFHRSIVTFEAVRTLWTEYREKFVETETIITNPKYRDTTRISMGVEHYIGIDRALRYGFTHFPHYSRSSADMTMITAGYGTKVGDNVFLDFGGSYGRRSFIGDVILEAEAGDTTSDGVDKEDVDERVIHIGATLTWKFPVKHKGRRRMAFEEQADVIPQRAAPEIGEE